MNLEPFTGPGSTSSRRELWDKVVAAVMSARKTEGKNTSVTEYEGQGTLVAFRRDTGSAPPTDCPPPNPCTVDVEWDVVIPGTITPIIVTGKPVPGPYTDSEWFAEPFEPGGYHPPGGEHITCGGFFGIHVFDPDNGYYWNVWFYLSRFSGHPDFDDGWWIFPQAGQTGGCLWWADPDEFAGIFLGADDSIFTMPLAVDPITMYPIGCDPSIPQGTITMTFYPCE